MKAFRTIFKLVVVVVAIGVLWYMARSAVSQHIVAPLDEYVASTTNARVASSTSVMNQTSSVWMASSTIVNLLLPADESTSTPTHPVVVPTKPTKSVAPLPPPVLTARSTLSDGYIRAPQGTIRVVTAKTPSTREQGLSGYTSLAADQGMLFIFPKSGSVNFWMKNMNFPIDIVWMNSDRKILGVNTNISPESYPKTFTSPGKIQFVLELNAGSAEKFGLRRGTTVIF
jgi:uncharacterized membrane protein (UPF0127 family)